MIAITVHGTPAPQGSKRAIVRGGRAHLIESSHDRVKSWRQAVVDAALGEDWMQLRGPVEVDVTFRLKRPKGHYRTGRNAHLLRDGAPAYPATMPDLDKLLRATMDALTAAGVWADDAQVVTVTAAKTYGQPGADITVRQAAS
jgi:Holliday junction resolvase RusA-like endonuclease